MTAAPERRRRATRLALVATALVLLIVAGAGVVGARALYHSTDSRDANGATRETVPMPATSNALLGVVGDEGQLTSAAVLTLAPTDDDDESAAPGGSIVPLPVNAAVPSHEDGGGEIPLAERFDGDAETLGHVTGSALGVTFDQVMVVEDATLAELLGPVTDAPLELPADVVAGDGFEAVTVVEAGDHQISGDDAAQILASGSPAQGERLPAMADNAAAVWSAIAEERTAAAEGQIETATSQSPGSATSESHDSTGGSDGPGGSGAESTPDAGPELPELMERLLAGPLEVRRLNATPVDDTDTPLVELDPIDARLVFGQLSPLKVVETSPSYSVRVVAPFGDDDLAGGTSADAAYEAIELLVEEDINVVSVSTSSGDVPGETHIDVVNRDAEDFAGVLGTELFGDHTLDESRTNLAGIDLVVTLGEEFVA